MYAQRRLLPGLGVAAALRWHWQHGPIDLVVQAEGEPGAVAAAHDSAWAQFEGLLAGLVAELPLLRQPVQPGANPLHGLVARRMWAVCEPLVLSASSQPLFITPMAAVAGAVAQALIAHYRRPGIQRAWVNNGGDIALHLAPGQSVQVGLVADLSTLDAPALARTVAGKQAPDGRFAVHADDPVRGVATSGWRGRSFSLGIADSVTILAASAAQADAAATVVANAVDGPFAGIQRRPACELKDDSDLGERLVTVAVPPLSQLQRQQVLQAGLAQARILQAAGLIHAAALVCQGSLAALPPRHSLQCQAELVQ